MHYGLGLLNRWGERREKGLCSAYVWIKTLIYIRNKVYIKEIFFLNFCNRKLFFRLSAYSSLTPLYNSTIRLFAQMFVFIIFL